MRYLVRGTQMKEIDRYTIEEIGIPSLVLMERAALAVAHEAHLAAGPYGRILAAAGLGNNGADAVAAARMLKEMGHPVSVILVGDPGRGTPELKLQLSIAEKLDIPVETFRDFIPGPCQVLVDGVFGVGLNRPVTGVYGDFLRFLGEIQADTVVAVDVPSGVSSETGAILVRPCGRTDGHLRLREAGNGPVPGKGLPGAPGGGGRRISGGGGQPPGGSGLHLREGGFKPPAGPPAYSNKGTFGKVLIAGGRKNMAGAAYLAALAAYRTGAGLVKILTPEPNRVILQTLLPEAVLVPWEEGNLREEVVEQLCREASSVVLGRAWARRDGEGPGAHGFKLRLLPGGAGRRRAERRGGLRGPDPVLHGKHRHHPPCAGDGQTAGRPGGGGAAGSGGDGPGLRRRFGITCVLKDAATVVAGRDGSLYVNSSGCSAMAKGGSGTCWRESSAVSWPRHGGGAGRGPGGLPPRAGGRAGRRGAWLPGGAGPGSGQPPVKTI